MRILIAGFPHSGTSILRKIIGNHPEVHDYYQSEVARYPRPRGLGVFKRLLPYEYCGKRHVVFKIPRHDVELSTNADRIIYVIKNPFDVFASLNIRSESALPDSCSLAAWQDYAKYFLDKRFSGRCYKVRYEDLFPHDFALVKAIFSWLDLDWDDSVLNTESRYTPIRYEGHMPSSEPPRTQHPAFRAWQTSQKLENLAGRNRHFLDDRVRRAVEDLLEVRMLGYSAESLSPTPRLMYGDGALSNPFRTLPVSA